MAKSEKGKKGTPKEEEKVSIREFAKRMDVDEKIIRRAIKEGRIVKGVEGEGRTTRIKVKTAAQEYHANRNPMHHKASVAVNAGSESTTGVSDEVIGEALKSGEIPPYEKMTEAQIKRLQAYKDLLLTELELRQKKGELVSRKLVNHNMALMAIELANKIGGIANACTDNVRSASNRAAAHKYLHDYCININQDISNLGSRMDDKMES